MKAGWPLPTGKGRRHKKGFLCGRSLREGGVLAFWEAWFG